MRPLGDGELVAQARQGSREAAAELFTRHWPGAWKVARTVTGRRDMADDVAQDAFERAFAALGRFDRRRPFGPWLHRIVVNRSLDLLRSERRLIGPDALDRVQGEWRDRAGEDRELLAGVGGLPLVGGGSHHHHATPPPARAHQAGIQLPRGAVAFAAAADGRVWLSASSGTRLHGAPATAFGLSPGAVWSIVGTRGSVEAVG